MRAAKQYIVDALEGSAEISALVGERIYHRRPPVAPEFPLITYSEVTATGDRADSKLYFMRPRMEVRAWGGDPEDLQEAIIAALEEIPCAAFVAATELWDPDLQVETVLVEYRLLVRV